MPGISLWHNRCCYFLLKLLAVELLNVLHRLLLTRDPPAVQLQVSAVVQETIRAAQDHLQQQRTSKGQEITHPTDSALLTLFYLTLD